MAKLESINSDRIEWCCRDRGISPEFLASKLKFSWEAFQKVLHGRGGLTFLQLRRVAEFFNRSTLFFLESGPVNSDLVHSPQFRSITNQKPDISPKVKALIERVERQRDIYLGLLEGRDDEPPSKFMPPQFKTKNIEEAAIITRRWLALSNENDFDGYRRAIEEKGILVFRSNGYNGPWQIPKKDPICGFTVYDKICPVIVVKKMPAETRQVFTLMHELAHLLLHRKSFIDDADDLLSYQGRERTANAFAGLLLLPNEVLSLVDDSERPGNVNQFDSWLRPVTKRLGISSEVVLRRLLDSDRLEQSDYQDYREWREKQALPIDTRGSRLFRHREPKHIFGDPYVGVVLDALHEKKITLSKASTYLDNLKISDVHQLENFYAGI